MTLEATDGSPMVLMPGPLLPAEMTSWTPPSMRRVVEAGPGVVAVVEGRQATDRHVDHVDATVLDEVDHAVGQRDRGAATAPRAGSAWRRPWRRAPDRPSAPPNRLWPAAMPATWVPWAASTTPMLTKSAVAGQAGRRQVDVLAVLDHERHRLGDRGRRVVGAEVADVEVLLVGPHLLGGGEGLVLVGVDPDVVGGLVVEDAPAVGRVTVAVEVTAGLVGGGDALGDPVELVAAGGRSGPRAAPGR